MGLCYTCGLSQICNSCQLNKNYTIYTETVNKVNKKIKLHMLLVKLNTTMEKHTVQCHQKRKKK